MAESEIAKSKRFSKEADSAEREQGKHFTFHEELHWNATAKQFEKNPRMMEQMLNLSVFDEATLLYLTRICGPVSKIPLLKVSKKVKWLDSSLNQVLKSRT